jgi:hypothetical protein
LAETGVSICTRNVVMTGLRFLIPSNAAASGPRGRDVSPVRTAEDPTGDKYG